MRDGTGQLIKLKGLSVELRDYRQSFNFAHGGFNLVYFSRSGSEWEFVSSDHSRKMAEGAEIWGKYNWNNGLKLEH